MLDLKSTGISTPVVINTPSRKKLLYEEKSSYHFIRFNNFAVFT